MAISTAAQRRSVTQEGLITPETINWSPKRRDVAWIYRMIGVLDYGDLAFTFVVRDAGADIVVDPVSSTGADFIVRSIGAASGTSRFVA